MQYRQLGRNGPKISAIGLGCMGMSEFYGPGNDRKSLTIIAHAFDRGINFLDTADIYGNGHNEELVGQAIKNKREKVVLATKFGNVRDKDGNFLGVNGKPDYIKSACESSLKRLKTDYIDLYYQHRVDSNTPIEETIGAMLVLLKEGKIRYLGLSEAAPDTIQRANKIYPITALQTEYSLWSREPESLILPLCRQLGIGFVAYSPLGRGFLTGKIKSIDELDKTDWRRTSPRFLKDNFTYNYQIVEKLEEIANDKKSQPAQIALAWLLSQGMDIIPIPGTRRLNYLDENIKSADIKLTADELVWLNKIAPPDFPKGTRYPEPAMKYIDL